MNKRIHKLGGKEHIAHGVYAWFGHYVDVVEGDKLRKSYQFTPEVMVRVGKKWYTWV